MKLKQRIISYLEKKNCDVNCNELIAEAKKAGYSTDDIFDALKELAETTANIGQWQDAQTKVNYLRWYEPNELTAKVQECIDRGDDW